MSSYDELHVQINNLEEEIGDLEAEIDRLNEENRRLVEKNDETKYRLRWTRKNFREMRWLKRAYKDALNAMLNDIWGFHRCIYHDRAGWVKLTGEVTPYCHRLKTPLFECLGCRLRRYCPEDEEECPHTRRMFRSYRDGKKLAKPQFQCLDCEQWIEPGSLAPNRPQNPHLEPELEALPAQKRITGGHGKAGENEPGSSASNDHGRGEKTEGWSPAGGGHGREKADEPNETMEATE